MRLIQFRFASALGIATVVILAQGCAHRTTQTSATAASRCAGTPTLIVHNNTGADVEVYEYRAGTKIVIGTVSPGTRQLTLTVDDPKVSYGAQPVGGTALLATTSRQRAGDRVRLERGCA
jgi:hypothetical protein